MQISKNISKECQSVGKAKTTSNKNDIAPHLVGRESSYPRIGGYRRTTTSTPAASERILYRLYRVTGGKRWTADNEHERERSYAASRGRDKEKGRKRYTRPSSRTPVRGFLSRRYTPCAQHMTRARGLCTLGESSRGFIRREVVLTII